MDLVTILPTHYIPYVCIFPRLMLKKYLGWAIYSFEGAFRPQRGITFKKCNRLARKVKLARLGREQTNYTIFWSLSQSIG